jgi:vitamin B12 transporter
MKTFAVIGLALAPALAFADPAVPPPNDNTDLQQVFVTATRTPVEQANTLSQTIVIDRAQIEQSQAIDVGQILQQYAGLNVARSGGPGQPASLFIRGGNSDYTLVLIDGVRVNDGVSGDSLISFISPEVIERIEVIEGPLSTLYGSDAISGVVNIITRKPGPGQLDAEIGGGSFDTAQGGVALRDQGSVAGHPWGVAVAAQQLHSAGIPTYAGADQASEYRNRTLSGNGSLELGGVKLEARAWDTSGLNPYLSAQFDCAGVNAIPGFAPCNQTFRDRVFALRASTHLTQNWFSELTLSRSEDRLDFIQGDFLTRTVRPEADWHNVLRLDQHNRVSFGALARREHDDSPSANGSFQEKDNNDYGYAQEEADYGRHHGVAAVSYLHESAFGERFDWNAQYGFDLFEHTRLIAEAGTAFHTPTALDRFYPGDGNPNLLPEKARDYELAVKQRIDGHQTAELRVFRTDVRDLIDGAAFPPMNLGRARLEGLQADWNYSDSNWTARLNGIAQNPRDLETGVELPQRARLSLGAQLNRHLSRYDLGAAFYTAARRADNFFNTTTFTSTPITDAGYATLDLSAGVRLTRELRFDLRGTNVLNHHYQTVAAYNQPGSAVYATLRYLLPL